MKKTPLFEKHVALKATMVPFAGYEMPVQYTSIVKEHEAVRNSMGLFDVSHMGEFEVKGPKALEFCQRVSTNNAAALKPGKVQYSAILNERGGVIDDCLLYAMGDEYYLFVVNASRREQVAKWFESHALEGAEVVDRSEEYALLALQGKKAEALLSALVKRDLATVKYYEFTWAELLGSAVLISRTGYSGEDGFELYLKPEIAADVWDLLFKEGEESGLVPIGLGARDTLRLEMGYLLNGSDMNEDITPLEAGIGWAVKLDKGNFVGREVLLKQKEEGLKRRLRAIKVTGRGIPRPGFDVKKDGKCVGALTSGTFSPTLKCGIALGMLDVDVALKDEVQIHIRNKEVPGKVVKPPFVPGSIKR